MQPKLVFKKPDTSELSIVPVEIYRVTSQNYTLIAPQRHGKNPNLLENRSRTMNLPESLGFLLFSNNIQFASIQLLKKSSPNGVKHVY